MERQDSKQAARSSRDDKAARLSTIPRYFEKPPALITISEIVSGMSFEDIARMKVEVDATATLDGKSPANVAVSRDLNYQQRMTFEKSVPSTLSDAGRVSRLCRSMRPWQKLLIDIVMENNGFLETEAAYSELLLRLEEQGLGEEVTSARRAVMFLHDDFWPAKIGWIAYTLPFMAHISRFEHYIQWYTVVPSPARGLMKQGKPATATKTTLLHQMREQGTMEPSHSPGVLLAILLLTLEVRKNGLKVTGPKKRQRKGVELPDMVYGALAPANVLTLGQSEGERCGISAFVVGACLALGILRVSDEQLLVVNEAKALDFLGSPSSERLGAIFTRWLESGRWYNEFSRMGMVQCTLSWGSRPKPRKIQVLSGLPDARRRLCQFLSSCCVGIPPGNASPWFDHGSLKSSFLHAEKDFASSLSDLHFGHMQDDDIEDVTSSQEWSFREGLADAMVEVLYWLRVVELCVVGDAPDRSAKGYRDRLGIRITPLGRALLDSGTAGDRPPTTPNKATGMKVTPDFNVIVPVEPDNHEAIFSLDGMLERTSTGSAFVYRIAPSAIESSVEYRTLLKLLSRFSSSPLPANIEHEVLEWSRKAKRITLLEGRTCVLLEDDDGTLYHELLNIPEVRSCLEMVERNDGEQVASEEGKRALLLVRSGATTRLARALKKRGFLLGREVGW